MLRHVRFVIVAAVAAMLLSALVHPAAAQKGTFSLGGNFGTGMYSNNDINDVLALLDVEKIESGWEYGGSLRYKVGPRVALDLEFNRMVPKSTTATPPEPDVILSTPGMAIPLSLYYAVSENDRYRFNVFGGAGIVTSAEFRGEQSGAEDVSLDAKSGFYGHAGLETEWLVSPQFSLSARALGRMASAEIKGSDPNVDVTTLDIEYGGFAFGLGARVSFGGGGN